MQNNERPSIVSIILSAVLGVFPGIGFALSVWVSLALITLILRAVHIFN